MALDVLLVRGEGVYSTPEQAVVAALEGRGDTVTALRDDDTTSWPDTSAYDVIIHGQSASAIIDESGALSDPRGVVTFRNWDSLWNLCGSFSNGLSQTEVDIVDDTHPIAVAAGVSNGAVTVYPQGQRTRRANSGVPAGADVVADYATVSGDPVIFAFEGGATLTTGTAAGRRVAFGPDESDEWNANGEALFLASVDWAVGASTGTTAALTGTLANDATESEIVDGGETLIITLTNDTWEATVGADNAITQAIIDGLDSDGAETNGWDAEVQAGLDFDDVTRDSDTQVTITLPAFASYDITADETITVTVPASALVTSGDPVVADSTFDVTAEGGLLRAGINRGLINGGLINNGLIR